MPNTNILQGSAMLVQAKMFMDGTGKDTENFENAIRNYVMKYQFSNAEQSELYEELNKVKKNLEYLLQLKELNFDKS